jgi:hypothetical protein
MRFFQWVPKAAWPLLVFPAAFLAASFTGCSGPSPEDPAVKAEIKARQAEMRKDEELENADAKKRGGKRSGIVKSIKGNLGGGGPADTD